MLWKLSQQLNSNKKQCTSLGLYTPLVVQNTQVPRNNFVLQHRTCGNVYAVTVIGNDNDCSLQLNRKGKGHSAGQNTTFSHSTPSALLPSLSLLSRLCVVLALRDTFFPKVTSPETVR